MNRVNKDVLEHLIRARNVFNADPFENYLFEADFVAIRTGAREEDIAIVESKNMIVFEDQLDKQDMTRMTIERSNSNYRTEEEYKNLKKFLHDKYPEVLDSYKNRILNGFQ